MEQKAKVVVKVETVLRKYPAGTAPEDIASGKVRPKEIIRKVVLNNADDRRV